MTNCYRLYRRRWRHPAALAGVALVLVAYLSWTVDEQQVHKRLGRQLLAQKSGNLSKNDTPQRSPQFPPDLFTPEQMRKGAVILHVVGMIYMFVALAIVCDEFFIPALYVITDKFNISEDVAGATFMAAGGSAPELFTSVIGVFISFDDVGIGTIVGSAVFNILFVISMCAIFSKTVLHLTWWPLFRDVSFYSLSLIILMLCFRDNIIFWYEAFILLLCYAAYVTFMKFNEQVERRVKKLLTRNKVTRVGSTDQLMPHLTRRRMSTPMLHGAGTKFRHGLLQLMIHTIDPLHEGTGGKLDEKASQLHAIASLRVLLDATKSNGTLQNGAPRCSACANCPACNHQCSCNVQTTSLDGNPDVHIQPPSPDTRNSLSVDKEISRADTIPNLQADRGPQIPRSNTADARMEMSRKDTSESLSNKANNLSTVTIAEPNNPMPPPEVETTIPEEEGDEPLDLSWPPTLRKQFNYVALAPIIFPLWLTLPDVRRPEKRRWFPVSFLGSILWIAIFSYLMVWWATQVGDTVGLPSEVMGLTFLAAGTSIPDLITSVLVARKGFGDMAVSSSVGSNIFDVTVGLPLPWLLACIVFGPVKVNSTGMVCSIFILFLMLLFVIISIAVFKWKLNIGLAVVMFLLYFLFIAASLILEYHVISCTNIIAALTGH